MIVFIEDLLGAVSGILLLVVLVFLLRGLSRRYAFILLYVAWELFATIFLTIADRLYAGSAVSTGAPLTEGQLLYNHLYWTNDIIVDLLRFLVLMVLTYQATPEGPRRGSVGRLLGGVAIIVIAAPVILFHPTFSPWPSGRWFNSATELLNFGAAIMNLVLWGTLIASKMRDPKLLTVSAGLGVVVTGAAFSYGLRHFIPPGIFRNAVPDLFLMLTQLAGWTIWCWAFRPVSKPRPAPASALTQH
jgi:hypothetical protein